MAISMVKYTHQALVSFIAGTKALVWRPQPRYPMA
jgi:hypothetical protein